MSTARSGSRTPTARKSCGSIRETGQWENLGSFSDPANGKRFGVYGIRADSDNNLYLLDFQSSNIGLIDAKTGEFTVYRGEIANSRPRRGAVDDQNRLWYAEYAGNAVGMVDPKTETGQGMGAADAVGAALRRRASTRTARPGPAR